LSEYLVDLRMVPFLEKEQIVARDIGDSCENREEVVRRVLNENFEFTVNLSPWMDPDDLKWNLWEEDIKVDAVPFLETGVFDVLAVDKSGELRFIEVKSPEDGLRESQLHWMRKHGVEKGIAWVLEKPDRVDAPEKVIGDSELFELESEVASRKKAVKRILWVAYANHTQAKEHREMAEVIIQRLRRDDLVKKQELMEEVGLEPDSENDDQKFKRVMRPLKGQKNSNPLDIQFVVQRRLDDGSFYALSRDAFDASSRTVIQNLRRFIDSEPRREMIELKEENQDLQQRVEELEDRLDQLRG